MKAVVDTLAGAIIKRTSSGHQHGIAVIAEGLVLGIDPADLAGIDMVERDDHGNVRISEFNLGDALKGQVAKRLKEFNLKPTIVSKNIGYELRCADPIPLDMEYTRDLGYCAAEFLLSGGNAAVITIQGGDFVPVPFAGMLDPQSGRPRIRLVDTRSTRYSIARRYMIRLRREDFEDPYELAKLAAAANVSTDRFRQEFEAIVANEPPPFRIDGLPAAGLA
jgi:6-phosphofructokinase 1